METNKTVKVSVIVPVYNVDKYLRKCLDSLVSQTLKDIEILVINDSSPDDSQAIIDEYKEKYPQIRSFIKENGGVSSVRNYGLKAAEGEYIGFVDGDDYIEKDMYEKLYNLAKSSDANVAVCAYYYNEDGKETVRKEFHYRNTKEMLTRFYGVLWNKIYKKEYIDSLDFSFPEGRRFEDSSYLTHMALTMKDFVFTDEPLIHYVQRKGSLTNTSSKTVLDAIEMLNDLRTYYKEKGKDEEFRSELEYVFIRFCLGNPFLTGCKIADKKVRREVLDALWNTLDSNYPEWHDNPYLKTLPGLKNRYFRMVNKAMFDFMSFICSFIK
ncbi:MAG: glycosyltransferase [Erysipelotrichaceae bacterium]|nr:glycosyltransferase [Erysipelotrichaceae bacterium]